jgi:nicotinamide-nucleotide amidase
LHRSRADWALAITGIAGPDGGTVGKPVGTVCFAWTARAGGMMTETRRFAGGREAVRAQSAARALKGLLERLAPPEKSVT